MEIVLGISMTPTTVRMVLVEGEKADGVTVDHDVLDITAIDGSATSSAVDQVIAALLGTNESAAASGHHLVSTGVTWSDREDAAAVRDELAARDIEDVVLVSELHAGAALAQAVGQAVGYAKTGLMFIDRDSATLSVVETADGSIVKVDSRSLHSVDAMAELTAMVTGLEAHPSPPEAIFVVGAGVDVAGVKAHLENIVSIPVSAPEEPEFALARGAALASANTPRFEASTVGLAAEGYRMGLANVDTQLAPTEVEGATEGRKSFLLVGSSLAAIFVVGVVALIISLAVSIRPTAASRPNPSQNGVVPSAEAAPPPVPAAAPAVQTQAPQTIQEPAPVVQQQQALRSVAVEAPTAPAAAPAPPPAVAPSPVPADTPAPAATPAPVETPPPVETPQPAYVPPVPVYTPPPVYVPPLYGSPGYPGYGPGPEYRPEPRHQLPWDGRGSGGGWPWWPYPNH